MTKIGIDPSINSTGVCVIEDNKLPIYYLITSKATKKMKLINNKRFNLVEYPYKSSNGLKSFEKENTKSSNVYNICLIIKEIINRYHPDIINMEAIAFAANGTIDQLAGLNYGIRNIVIDYYGSNNYEKHMFVIPPTTIKLWAVGNGQATKEAIIKTWTLLDNDMYESTKEIKQDDLADAFIIASFSF